MHALNPDIYGTETAGKSTSDIHFDFIDASVEIRMMKVATTKGYPIEAWYYAEVGTVQFIYSGEMNPGGMWYTDMDSDDVLMAAYPDGPDECGGILNITHQQKIDALGAPSMNI